jgi:hypothetical protein
MFCRRHLSIAVVASFLLTVSAIPALAAPKGSAVHPAAPAADYAKALAAADHFLQSWQSGDIESGAVLLTAQAKKKISSSALDNLFSSSAPTAYEIARGKQLRPGRYEFPVVLFGGSSGQHRRFSSIVVLNTGNNDWAIDKLP